MTENPFDSFLETLDSEHPGAPLSDKAQPEHKGQSPRVSAISGKPLRRELRRGRLTVGTASMEDVLAERNRVLDRRDKVADASRPKNS